MCYSTRTSIIIFFYEHDEMNERSKKIERERGGKWGGRECLIGEKRHQKARRSTRGWQSKWKLEPNKKKAGRRWSSVQRVFPMFLLCKWETCFDCYFHICVLFVFFIGFKGLTRLFCSFLTFSILFGFIVVVFHFFPNCE